MFGICFIFSTRSCRCSVCISRCRVFRCVATSSATEANPQTWHTRRRCVERT
ncbi:hypothetical protein FOXYSP1_18852 [Fusarium oxysporum f. sp. phaseoli]